MPHKHEPYAEVDSDGMYEPRCEGCDIFTDPSIISVVRRWPTWHEAAAAAASIIAVLEEPDEEEVEHAMVPPSAADLRWTCTACDWSASAQFATPITRAESWIERHGRG